MATKTKLLSIRISEQTDAALLETAKRLDRARNWVIVSILESALEKGQAPEYLAPLLSGSDDSASHAHPTVAPVQPAGAS